MPRIMCDRHVIVMCDRRVIVTPISLFRGKLLHRVSKRYPLIALIMPMQSSIFCTAIL